MDLAIAIILTILAFLLVLTGLAMIIIIKKRKEANIPVNYNKPFIFQWITGTVLCLAGAFFMWNSDFFGENTTGIARIMGILGIGLIATSGMTLKAFMRKPDR